jgi:hypothetical protein
VVARLECPNRRGKASVGEDARPRALGRVRAARFPIGMRELRWGADERCTSLPQDRSNKDLNDGKQWNCGHRAEDSAKFAEE